MIFLWLCCQGHNYHMPLFKHGPAGWSGWSVPPRRLLSRRVGWADGIHRDAHRDWGPPAWAASRATRRPVTRRMACRLGRRDTSRRTSRLGTARMGGVACDSEARGPKDGSPRLGGGARRVRLLWAELVVRSTALGGEYFRLHHQTVIRCSPMDASLNGNSNQAETNK